MNVNHLLDVVFKFNISLSESDKKQIGSTNLYYKWLTNISEFDYDLFMPAWINRHKSVYFIHEFRKHPPLRAALEKYLFSNDDYIVNRVYFLFSFIPFTID